MSDELEKMMDYGPAVKAFREREKQEAESSLAPARGSASPDCCAEWTRSAKAIEGLCVMAHIHGMEYKGAPFYYCPWCGRVRPNEKVQP